MAITVGTMCVTVRERCHFAATVRLVGKRRRKRQDANKRQDSVPTIPARIGPVERSRSTHLPGHPQGTHVLAGLGVLAFHLLPINTTAVTMASGGLVPSEPRDRCRLASMPEFNVELSRTAPNNERYISQLIRYQRPAVRLESRGSGRPV